MVPDANLHGNAGRARSSRSGAGVSRIVAENQRLPERRRILSVCLVFVRAARGEGGLGRNRMACTITLTRPVAATGSAEAQKAKIVGKAAAIAAEWLATTERDTAQRIVGLFCEHVPPADIAAGNPRDLAGAALSLWRFAARRRPAQAKVRVFNPDATHDGWSSPHTIVEIVNDDMPFLVDSVTAGINTAGRVVRLVVHPLPKVVRAADGRLVAFADGLDESWMHVEVTREQDPAQLARLAQELAGVLADVRVAVADWPMMRRTLLALLDELSASPLPPVPAAELAEVREFLRWLDDDNFTFLGYREYGFDGKAEPTRPPLGILRDADYPIFGGLRDLASLPADVQVFMRRPELLVVTKANRRATVHRRAHMDAIGLRRFDRDGRVVGVRLFLGLFTAPAYSREPWTIPLLRQKVRHIVERAGLSPTSHDGKALLHILDTLPRDELFQGEPDQLFATALGVLNLQERQRIALFVRRDPLERFVSCLVYAPRERYDSQLRRRFAEILTRAFAGSLSAFYTHLDDEVLARIQFIIRTTRGAVPAVDVAALERELAEAGRTWSDRFAEAAAAAFGEDGAQARLRRLLPLPVAYQARNEVAQAVADLERIDAVLAGSPLEVSLHADPDGSFSGLRLYRAEHPVVLSDVLPILENLGLRVVAEEPFRIDCSDGEAVWVHEFQLAEAAVANRDAADAAAARFEEALVAIWTEREENDGFNRLVLKAGLTIRQVGLLRLYGKFTRQAGSPYSQAYMEDTLSGYPEIGRRLVRLFEIRFDPGFAGDRSLAAIAEMQAIDHALDAVASLDEDRILRGYLTFVLKTVRTNYFQRLPAGGPKPYLAVKLASNTIDLLPRPRPLFEIYVYSPRVEAVHMRAGRVARGGIRWSDRKEDFRTEILGLMKAQTVKNAVIVPVGAKGGFVVKRPPKASDRLGDKAVECYRTFIRGLLDLTDNIVAEPAGGSRIVPPPEVVRYDGDDPYLVVAADKGTSAFSDYANAIAGEYGFWLGDAFASGGSSGYDHKALGITARGAWELVERHLRELGRNPATDELTVVGVGDMSGDVFGNGMLMSRHLRLVAAFDHRHIFVDPDPDAATGFAERQRLFRLPRSSWADYDRALISPGGGVFERSLKSIPMSAEMKRALDIDADRLTPAELIRKLLAAAVDLLWFGGIGTFVKAPEESQAEVADRANDGVRVDGDMLRAKVAGEGANLAVTERGRVAYALTGGRIDTDAIDNSAGVDASDHEVNIKILVDRAVVAGALMPEERGPLLAGMAQDVCRLVLRDNYLQGAALSLAEAEGVGALERQRRLIHELERRGLLDRALEFLPDDKALAARAAQRRGLVRPELAVLLAYAKLALDAELLASDLPDAPELAGTLADYFPPALHDRLGGHLRTHPLRREIVATAVANELVNRAGLTFAVDMQARTGRAAPLVARAYLIVREAYGLEALWAEIEALDGRVPAALQIGMLRDIGEVVGHAAGWMLRANRVEIAAETARLKPAVAELGKIATGLLPAPERALYDERATRLAGAGVPTPLAARLGQAIFLTTALDISDLATHTHLPMERVARTFYGIGARLALDDLRAAARALPAGGTWQRAAAETLIDDFYALQTDLARRVLETGTGADDPVAAWSESHAAALAAADSVAAELRAVAAPELAMLLVAGRRLRQAAD
jgi:glutamate dehydrogenase